MGIEFEIILTTVIIGRRIDAICPEGCTLY